MATTKIIFGQDFVELGPKSKRKIDDATGFMEVPGTLARAGVQEYRAHELQLTDRAPNAVVRLYRSADELAAAIPSANNKPITLGHPDKKRYPKGVTADNYAQLAKGHVSDVRMEGATQVGTLHIRDKGAVRALQNGTKQLSNGYAYMLDMTPGQSPEGEVYDGAQTRIVINHNAIVPMARGGEICRAADSNQGERHMEKVTVDDVEYEMDPTAASLVKTIVKARDGVMEDLAEMGKDITALKLVADSVAAKDTEIADLKKRVVSADQINQMVQDKAGVLTECAKRCPTIKTAGLDTAGIRRAMLTEITSKNAVAKKAADAAAGGAVDDKTPDSVVRTALDVIMVTVDTVAQDRTNTRKIVAASLCPTKANDGKSGTETEHQAADGKSDELVGRAAYTKNLTNDWRDTKTAGNQ